MKISLLVTLLFTILIVSQTNAQSTLVLQEKCAQGAKKFFFDHINLYGGKWGSFNDETFGRGRNHFISHYNKKLDQCFIRIEFHSFPEGKTHKAIDIIDIWNVFEGTRIGGLSTPMESPYFDCTVAGKACNSPSEFENLVRPYMEE
jgi:hypothetical protein